MWNGHGSCRERRQGTVALLSGIQWRQGPFVTVRVIFNSVEDATPDVVRDEVFDDENSVEFAM